MKKTKIDMQGRVIFNQHYKSYDAAKNMSIFIPSLESGTYLLTIDNKKTVDTKKITFCK
jgi:hypothetical protein